MQGTNQLRQSQVVWNKQTRLIISDVDETIVAAFKELDGPMLRALSKLLEQGIILFLISGQSYTNIFLRLARFIDSRLRKQLIIAHCNGAEAFGFDRQGKPLKQPLWSIINEPGHNPAPALQYDIIRHIAHEFDLQIFPLMPLADFQRISRQSPRAVMLDDRKVQISLDFANWLLFPGCRPCTGDPRKTILTKTNCLLREAGLELECKMGGQIALDLVIKGVHKGLAVKALIQSGPEFADRLPEKIIIAAPGEVEIWGDSFSCSQQGGDLAISLALAKESRSISFRAIDQTELPAGWNIISWPGRQKLQNGLLEYLATAGL